VRNPIKYRYRQLTFACLAGLCTAFIACNTIAQSRLEGKKITIVDDSGYSPETAQSRPRVTVRDELTVALSASEVELDFRKSYLASEAQLFTGLYEGLFSYHPFTMEPVPAVAEDWELSADKKEWTFRLRENAKYWNGDTVRAEDFRAAWLSLLEPARESPYSSLFDIIDGARAFRLGTQTDPQKVGISAPDDHTLVVRLNAPAAFFPSMLCHHSFSPIHPAMLKTGDWSTVSPLSNGPFYLFEQDSEKKTLARNEYYWDSFNVDLKKITLKYTNDGEDAAALWNSGEARWVSGEVDLDALTDRSGIEVNAMFATHYYYIRSVNKPWNDYHVRQALALALPWDAIREGYILPAETLIYPIPGYPEVTGLSETNIERARELLAAAGYPDGKGLPELVIRLNPSLESARIGGLLSGAWMDNLGVPITIDVVSFDRYFNSLKEKNYDVGASTWIGDFPDPYTFLQMWRRDSNLNDAGYNDSDYETLIDKSMTEEGDARWNTLAEAEKLLLERGAVLPISYTPAINIIDVDELDGWYANALDIHPFKYISFRKIKPLPGVALLR
jgi:peptide/nickel transport system substrate-binding protein/oligopeptide transport system substrate-binding protein